VSVSVFEYRATDSGGARTRGRVEAADAPAAIRAVRQLGLTPVSVTPASGGSRAGRGGLGGRVGLDRVAQFTLELETLLGAGAPIGEGLAAIAAQESDARVRGLATRIAKRVDSGWSIADALREHERVFGPVYLETVAAAERSGRMREALERLAATLERRAETGRKLRQAMLYPATVAVALFSGTAFLLAFVVPKFTGMFESRGVDLPALTRGLDVVGRSVQGWWWVYGLAIIGAAIGGRSAWASSAGRGAIERGLEATPVIGRTLRAVATARFARVLGMGLSAGIELPEAMEQAGRASGSAALSSECREAARRVRSGASLQEAVSGSRRLPVFAKRMLAAGEESGEAPKMCGVIAERYEREADSLCRNMGTLVEPVLIAALTGVVLLVALGIFVPMWDMASLAR